MTWFEAIPALTVAVLTVVLIGAPLAWAVGARGITFLAVGIAGSVSSIAVASVLAPLLGLPWQISTPLLVSLPLAALGLVLRRRLAIPSTGELRAEWNSVFAASMAAVALGGFLIALAVVPAIGHPDSPSQTYDGIFHLNAVQWILDTLDASPLHMTMATPDATSAFYPTTWHALVALIAQLTGASVVVATNVVAVTTVGLVWPVACVFLARALFGPKRLPLILAGVFSAAFGSFPYILLGFGVLYPNLLAVALLPIALGLLIIALGQDSGRMLTRAAGWLLLVWVVAGMTAAHPNALFSFLALSAPPLVQGCVSYVRRQGSELRGRLRAAAAISALLFTFAIEIFVWTRVGTSDNGWLPSRPFFVSMAEAAMNGPGDLRVALVVSVCAITGVIVTFFQRRFLWLTGTYLVAILLFAVANGGPVGHLRDAITGLWYNDSFRLAAILPVAALPLAVLGLLTIIRAANRLVGRVLARSSPARAAHPAAGALVTVVCVVVAVLGTQYSVGQSSRYLASSYRLGEASPLLSPTERSFFADVSRMVPPGSVVAGNPWNGSALVYAYTGRPALFPHVGGAYEQRYWDLAEGLADGTPSACRAAADLDVHYVLDFGDHYVFAQDRRATRYEGLTDIEDSRVLTQLAEESGLALYEVTGCAAP